MTDQPQQQRRREFHGHCPDSGPSPTYRSYASMLDRCTNENSVRWSYYGARGIAVCDRWLGSFTFFLADLGERPEGKTLDRIDGQGHYAPSNCRWATPVTQARNRRSTKLTMQAAREIRRQHASGEGGYRTIAARFGVTFSNVRDVVKGKTWIE